MNTKYECYNKKNNSCTKQQQYEQPASFGFDGTNVWDVG